MSQAVDRSETVMLLKQLEGTAYHNWLRCSDPAERERLYDAWVKRLNAWLFERDHRKAILADPRPTQ